MQQNGDNQKNELEPGLGEKKEGPIPPDSEELLERVGRLYNAAEEYWKSELGGARKSNFEFNKKTSDIRQEEIKVKLEILGATNLEANETEIETGNEVLDEQLMEELTKLMIEQAFSDMAEAALSRKDTLSRLDSLGGALSSAELPTLESMRDALVELDGSKTKLNVYLKQAAHDIKGYELYSRTDGDVAEYDRFMGDMLEEYHTKADASFAPDQKVDQQQSTFQWESQKITEKSPYSALLHQVQEKIEKLRAGEEEVGGIETEDKAKGEPEEENGEPKNNQNEEEGPQSGEVKSDDQTKEDSTDQS